jgi:hypothetical protein
VGRKKRSTNRSIPGNTRRDKGIRATRPRLDHRARPSATTVAARRDVAVDSHDGPVGIEPDQVEREPHRERVHRSAAQVQSAIGGERVQAAEPTPASAHPAGVVDTKAVI